MLFDLLRPDTQGKHATEPSISGSGSDTAAGYSPRRILGTQGDRLRHSKPGKKSIIC
jgi:hypothetical protein